MSIEDYTYHEIKKQFSSLGGNTKLSDYLDSDIEEEYEDRGLGCDRDLSDYSDSDIEKEYEARTPYSAEEELEKIIIDINLGKPTQSRVVSYLEKVSGKLITKSIK
jgi:hypothetical protein